MPISLLRSAASIEKIRKIKRRPTPIEKRPKVVKKETKRLPIWLASSTTCRFTSKISSPASTMGGRVPSLSRTSPVSFSPARASPRLEMSTDESKPCLSNSSCARRSGSMSTTLVLERLKYQPSITARTVSCLSSPGPSATPSTSPVLASRADAPSASIKTSPGAREERSAGLPSTSNRASNREAAPGSTPVSSALTSN